MRASILNGRTATFRIIHLCFCEMHVRARFVTMSALSLDAQPGQKPQGKPGELPMFKAAAKPTSAEGVGKYAIKFHWNDGHDLGIYSWQFRVMFVHVRSAKR